MEITAGFRMLLMARRPSSDFQGFRCLLILPRMFSWAERLATPLVVSQCFNSSDKLHSNTEDGGASCKIALQSLAVEFIFPTSNHQSGDCVADHVDEGSEHAHKTINAENQGHTGHGNVGNHHERTYERDKCCALYAARTLRCQDRHTQYCYLL